MSTYTAVPPASQGIDPNQYGQAGLGATTSNTWAGLANAAGTNYVNASPMSMYYSVTVEEWGAMSARIADLEHQVKVLKLATLDERAEQLKNSLKGS